MAGNADIPPAAEIDENVFRTPEGEREYVTQLPDGVFVWIQPGGESGVSNAGAIIDDTASRRVPHATRAAVPRTWHTTRPTTVNTGHSGPVVTSGEP
jgi:hypothetical protein